MFLMRWMHLLRCALIMAWLGGAVLLAPTVGHTAPAPWYWWVSKVDGRRFCAQTMPERGWERAQGPYRNADCTVAARRR